MLHAVIMAGGGGTRFWPRSRNLRPKQFLTVSGERSLLQSAFDRIEAQATAKRTWIITSAAHVQETAKQLPGLSADHIVGEPCGRDTAACIALGAALVARRDPDAVMVVMPADHVIEPIQEFGRAIQVSEQMALEHPKALVTFGITPRSPRPDTATSSAARRSATGRESESTGSRLFVKNQAPMPPNASWPQENTSGTAASSSGVLRPF